MSTHACGLALWRDTSRSTEEYFKCPSRPGGGVLGEGVDLSSRIYILDLIYEILET